MVGIVENDNARYVVIAKIFSVFPQSNDSKSKEFDSRTVSKWAVRTGSMESF